MMDGMKTLDHSLTAVVVSAVVLAGMCCSSGCGGGEEGDDGVAGLIEQLGSKDPDTHLHAAWALTKMRAKALGPLVEALRSSNRTLARRAGGVLASIGREAADRTGADRHPF